MSTSALMPRDAVLDPADAAAAMADVAAALKAGGIVPYLGPGLIELSRPEVPTSFEALASFFESKVALPQRAKGNAWASAQHIESRKHRNTVSALMTEAFAPPVAPTALHDYIAGLKLPLIVDTWYDGAMRAALDGSDGWGEVQGITRAGIGEDCWYRFYDAAGAESDRTAAAGWTTVLYKPHGSVVPAKNYLISDADYVEVLTEIDIQTPIPEVVTDRRAGKSFLFVGCRFNDQLLRTYARQIIKRSADKHYVLIEPDTLSKNEIRFLSAEGLIPIAMPLAQATECLLQAA